MEKVSVAHLFGPSGSASATTCGALKEQPGKMCPMRKSSLTCRHGDPVGLNSNFGKQPSELRRPISTHTHTHTLCPFASLCSPAFFLWSVSLRAHALLFQLRFLLHCWQRPGPFSHAEVRSGFPPSTVERTL